MEILLAVNIFVTGWVIGIIAADFWQRQKIRQQLMAELEATRNLCGVINESHNSLVQKTQKLGDRVAAFEMLQGRPR